MSRRKSFEIAKADFAETLSARSEKIPRTRLGWWLKIWFREDGQIALKKARKSGEEDYPDSSDDVNEPWEGTEATRATALARLAAKGRVKVSAEKTALEKAEPLPHRVPTELAQPPELSPDPASLPPQPQSSDSLPQ